MPTESNGLYANGRLLYLHDQALLSRRFDVNALRLDATSAPLAEGVGVHGGMHLADFTASQNGLLAYFPGPANQGWPMVMYNRSGKPEGRVYSERNFYLDPRFPPDGKRLAVSIARSGSMLGDLWVIDIQAGTRTRLKFESRNATHPVWSADEKSIYYSAANGPDQVPHIYSRLVNGSETEGAVLETPGAEDGRFRPAGGADPAWASDGRRLYYMDSAENIMYVDVRTTGTVVRINKPVQFARDTTFSMPRPLAVAPDGRILVDGHNDEPQASLTMTLVTNWTSELKR